MHLRPLADARGVAHNPVGTLMSQTKSLITTLLASTLTLAGCDDKSDEQTPSVATQGDPLNAPTAPPTAGQTNADDTTQGTTTATVGDAGTEETGQEAEAEFQTVPGMKITGEAEFTELANGVRIEIELENAPTGEKGIHIHETDDCSDIANKSMGGHFAPKGAQHALPPAPERHLGDLGNITIDSDDNDELKITIPGANLKDNDAMSFIGKAVVLHEANDKGTGEAGDAGKPIACAPIKAK